MTRRTSSRFTRLAAVGLAAVLGATTVPLLAQTSGGNGQANKGRMRSTTQKQRNDARLHQPPQKTGVSKRFAGVNPKTATLSPLAPAGKGNGPGLLAPMAPLGTPDYFAIANWANSPLPQLDGNGNIAVGTGIRKFVDSLPGLCGVAGANDLGQCLPIAVPDTTTFAGSDFYRIGLMDYTQQMHADLPATKLRGYVQIDSSGQAVGTQQYLGPIILATRNRPVRILFQNELAPASLGGHLFVPVDTTYMGAGMVNDGTNNVLASEQRATVHLHGGATPWISDGTPHQWLTPAGGDGQPAALGFAKGFSFQNVPDMPSTLGFTPSLTDGIGTYYWTNEQSGKLLFYHDHAYGTTRLNVYAGEAAGYLIVDPAEESALATATVPGTIVTDPTSGAIVSADLAHVIPLVIQDKSFVPDGGAPGGQLAAQDPTWDVNGLGAAGDLWFPHVYMPNQNPYDITGANAFGRWDYGPWFWPPQPTSIPPVPCTSAAYPNQTVTCPGTPNPSGTPEAFMDTPVINGTVYPTLTVDPTAYRFRILSVGNDRTFNLGFYVAEPLSISVTTGGSGYVAPTVTVDQTACPGAVASVTLSGDVVAGISVTSYGSGCTAVPAITITDGFGTGAAAVASIDTEVKMVPAVPANARSIPDCATRLRMDGGGLVEAVDSNGNLVTTPTGLLANCWPTYTSIYGDMSWPVDARDGGVPDPLTAGPPIVQIGTEGGLLPNPIVIPSTPISYDYNKRSITVLNVLNHGLLLGPAERADIVVDFSAFAGKTLILYNDAPAPVPAADPRTDYYTNGPDQTPTGGAPTTMVGYGPNTRTLMQIRVNNIAPSSAFNVATLQAAQPGIFAATQDRIIVPESAYPAGNGNGPNTYVRIQDTSLAAWIGAGIGALTLTSGGAGYSSAPSVAIDPPTTCTLNGTTCVQATATATLATRAVASVNLSNSGGFGYTAVPAVTLSGGGGSGASATAALSNAGGVRSIAVTSGGSGYQSAPTVVISPPGCAPGPTCVQATATATVRANGQRNVTGVSVTNSGAGYTSVPTVSFTPTNGGSGAAATASLGYPVANFTVAGGSGYSSAPTVSVASPPSANCVPSSICTTATATATLATSPVTTLALTNPGNGYTSQPGVSFSGGGSPITAATATVSAPLNTLLPKAIQELFTNDYGRMNALLGVEVPFTSALIQTTIPYGYVDPPTEVFKDGETQLWKITHNGVDTHFIHVHLFDVQVINRVGWDGAIKPPDPNELSWKDTVRMNPLEDIIVALRPIKPTVPWDLPNSVRPLDVTMPVGTTGQFLNVDPTNQPATVYNDLTNFGWEYVWHCHILGHEENDMMRAMTFVVTPNAPSGLTAVKTGNGNNQQVNLAWADNSANETGFTIQRATSLAGPWTSVTTVGANVTSYTDATVARGTTYFYRVVANNVVGYTRTYVAPAVGYPNTSADSTPAVSASVTIN